MQLKVDFISTKNVLQSLPAPQKPPLTAGYWLAMGRVGEYEYMGSMGIQVFLGVSVSFVNIRGFLLCGFLWQLVFMEVYGFVFLLISLVISMARMLKTR